MAIYSFRIRKGKYELDEYEMWYLNPTYKQRKAQEYALPLRDILRKNFHNHFEKITKNGVFDCDVRLSLEPKNESITTAIPNDGTIPAELKR